jgi:two-component system nitrate/nitrite response regulator NarL
MTIRLVIVGGVPLYCEGLALALSRDHAFDVVATTSDPATASAVLAHSPADLLLLDMTVPDSLGFARTLAAENPDVPLVAVSVTESEASVIACAEAGVAAYVPWDATLEDLADVLRRAARGEASCPPRITAGLIRRLAVLSAERSALSPPSPLTRREEQIVSLMDEGLSNKEIAEQLVIQVATVKNHVHSILEKLDVSRRGQAVARMRLLRSSPPLDTGVARR